VVISGITCACSGKLGHASFSLFLDKVYAPRSESYGEEACKNIDVCEYLLPK
jgi:hypothetical protein